MNGAVDQLFSSAMARSCTSTLRVLLVTLPCLHGCNAPPQNAGAHYEPAPAGSTANQTPQPRRTESAAAAPGPLLTPLERSAMREKAIEVLNKGALARDPLVRANSLEGLETAPSRAESAIRAGLVDENTGVRFTAAMLVGRLKLTSSAPFVEPLAQDYDPRVRAAALFALTRCGRTIDLTPLARMLEDPDPRIRAEAARIIGELGNTSAMPMLRMAAAESSRNSRGESGAADEARQAQEHIFQLQVAEALARLGDPSASDAVRAALYPPSREGFEASALAAQILGGLRDPKAVAQMVDIIEQKVDGTPTAGDPRRLEYLQPKEVRLACAASLARMDYVDGVYVADMYADDPDPMIRALAAFVYGYARRPSGIARLDGMLEDPAPVVRTAAAAAMLKALEPARP